MFEIASSVGSNAASDTARSACACSMLERAVMMLGLTSCAASISSTSKRSFCYCHHCDRLLKLPLCGRLLVALTCGVVDAADALAGHGAYHCGGAVIGMVKGGPVVVQPASKQTVIASTNVSEGIEAFALALQSSFPAGPPQGKLAPWGGRKLCEASDRGGQQLCVVIVCLSPVSSHGSLTSM